MRSWSISRNPTRIRRLVADGKFETHPAKLWKHLKDDPKALEDYVTRLNNRNPEAERVREVVRVRHSFISPGLLETYLEHILEDSTRPKNERRNYRYLVKHALPFFLVENDLKDLRAWPLHQEAWGRYLKKKGLSPAVINDIGIQLNRFIKWLELKRPGEVPNVRGNPILPLTKRQRDKYKSVRASEGKGEPSRYIPPSDVQKIRSSLTDPLLRACFEIAVRLGLREAEVLGLTLDDVKEAEVQVSRQLLALPAQDSPVLGTLKSYETRPVEYWFTTPADLYGWVETMLPRRCVPSNLSRRWTAAMRKLGMRWRFHDLRHTFITNALEEHPPRQVQLNAGHKSIATTMRYAHDPRQLKSKTFVPQSA